MRWGHAISLFVLLFGVYVISPTSASAALTLTSGDNATTTPSVATSITGFQIVGPAASTTPVKLRATSGILSVTGVSGVTLSGNNSGTITMSGTVEKLNQVLATLKYTRGSTGTDTLEVSLVEGTEVFFVDNGHLYQFVSGNFNWSAAQAAAAARTAYGVSGYLATITSLAENNFVYQRISGDGWLGTTDQETEKTWKWITGPEAGTAYYNEATRQPISGRYNGWADSEPNDYGDGEDCGYMYATQGGAWNDYPCETGQGYVVEFGADGALPTVVAKNISIVTADVPAVTTLTPANGAGNISTGANLVIGFSKTVTGDTGTVTIKKASDDSVVEAITASSGQVTGGGSSTITINPTANLEEGVSYYVTIAGTAFKDSSNNYFNGISNSSGWTFTTADETAPIISSRAANTTASTTATVTWTTNEQASTKVVYGVTSALGTTTPETNTSSRVTSHTVSLSGLLACTEYYYAAVSRDAALNSATSTTSTFTTPGCTASVTPTAATSTNITTTSGGSTSVDEGSKTFTVTAPANATATSSSFVIQVKAVPSDSVLAEIGRPTAVPNEIGATVFDVKAIVNGSTILDSFDAEITISYEYSESELTGMDERSLWLYHYSNGAWAALNSCTVDTGANTISCTTPSFSIFGLFGKAAVSGGGSSTIIYGCKDPKASNYSRFVAHKQDMCRYETVVVASTPVTTTPAPASATQFERNLETGMSGADVRALQVFLNTQGFKVAEVGLGSIGNETEKFGAGTHEALIQFQKEHGIAPASGYFGPLTRAYIATMSAQTAVPSTTAVVTGVRDLDMGMEGRDVIDLQALLMSQGYPIPAGATGYFSTQTRDALSAYQKKHGIVPSIGYFGVKTRTEMKAAGLSGLWW